LRDRGLLKLFFADVLDPDEAIAHVRAMRLRASDSLARFERDIEPASAAEESSGVYFPHITATFAIEFYRWVIDWCERLEAELDSEGHVVKSPRRATR